MRAPRQRRWQLFLAFIPQTLMYREQHTNLHLVDRKTITFAEVDSRECAQALGKCIKDSYPSSARLFLQILQSHLPFPLLHFPPVTDYWHLAFSSRTMFAYFLFLLLSKCFCLQAFKTCSNQTFLKSWLACSFKLSLVYKTFLRNQPPLFGLHIPY